MPTYAITRDEGGLGAETIVDGLTDREGAYQRFAYEIQKGHKNASVFSLVQFTGYISLVLEIEETGPKD